MIQAPRQRLSHPDRGIHAEEAMEASFDALAYKAEIMGWTRDEAAFALLNLAAARVLTIEANRSTEDAMGWDIKSAGRVGTALTRGRSTRA